jgi:hypothetical protein
MQASSRSITRRPTRSQDVRWPEIAVVERRRQGGFGESISQSRCNPGASRRGGDCSAPAFEVIRHQHRVSASNGSMAAAGSQASLGTVEIAQLAAPSDGSRRQP